MSYALCVRTCIACNHVNYTSVSLSMDSTKLCECAGFRLSHPIVNVLCVAGYVSAGGRGIGSRCKQAWIVTIAILPRVTCV